jgi:hypothetical protein
MAILYGAYFTKEREDDPVFHTFEDCPEGEKIHRDNKQYVLPDRRQCEVCVEMGCPH